MSVRYPNQSPPEILTPKLTAGLRAWPESEIELHGLGNLVTLAGRVVVDWTHPDIEGNTIFRGIPSDFWPSTNTTVTLWCETSDAARSVHGLRGVWAMNGGILQLNHTPWQLKDFRSIGFTVTTGRRPL